MQGDKEQSADLLSSSPDETIQRAIFLDADGDAETVFLERDALPPLPISVDSEVEEGEVIESISRYFVGDEIGRGGMAVIHAAQQEDIRRGIALKRLLPSLANDPRVRNAFLTEARVSGYLDHPNIVSIHGLTLDGDGQIALAMVRVRGETWASMLDARPGEDVQLGQPSKSDLRILLTLTQAVSYAHDKGVVHLDLKPDNVMIGRFGEVTLMDWGVAVDLGDGEGVIGRSGAPRKSSLQSLAGTPAYMAPEMAEMRYEDLGPWTDVFLLGGILYELITGNSPNQRTTTVGALEAALRKLPLDFPENTPPRLRAICEQALSRDIKDRFESADDLRGALDAYLDHQSSLRIAAKAQKELDVLETSCAGGSAPCDRPSLYSRFFDTISGFRQARELWEKNIDAEDGENAARLQFSETALVAGDLGLAGVILDGVSDGVAAEQMQRVHDLFDERRQTLRSARRRAACMVAAQVVFVVALVSYAYLKLDDMEHRSIVLIAGIALVVSLSITGWSIYRTSRRLRESMPGQTLDGPTSDPAS